MLMLGLAVPAAAQNAADAAIDAASAAESEGTRSEDYENFEPRMSEACTAGTVDSCWRLGLYYKGQYDLAAKARALYTRSCDLGMASSCSSLAGLMFSDSFTTGAAMTVAERTASQKLYQKACMGGDSYACDSWLSGQLEAP